MKCLFFLCLLAGLCSHAAAQPNDFILLKKRGKTVRRLFAGQYITASIDGAGPYDLLIKNVYKDSVRLMGYSLAQNSTAYGGLYIDTVERYYFVTHYASITGFYNDVRRNKNFNITSSGGTLMAAGVLGVLMTGINAAYLKEPLVGNGRPLFAAGSAALFGLGYLLFRQSIKPIVVGKKYQLVYVKVSG
jgi:hypothetical protein